MDVTLVNCQRISKPQAGADGDTSAGASAGHGAASASAPSTIGGWGERVRASTPQFVLRYPSTFFPN